MKCRILSKLASLFLHHFLESTGRPGTSARRRRPSLVCQRRKEDRRTITRRIRAHQRAVFASPVAARTTEKHSDDRGSGGCLAPSLVEAYSDSLRHRTKSPFFVLCLKSRLTLVFVQSHPRTFLSTHSPSLDYQYLFEIRFITCLPRAPSNGLHSRTR